MTPSLRKTAAATLACIAIPQALGDAIVVTRAGAASTIAELFVESDGMRVEIEVGAGGLEAFANLFPDEVCKALGLEPGDASGRIRAFFAEDWVTRFDGSPPVPGRVVRIRPGKRLARDEITGEPLSVQPDDAADILSVELAYAWDRPPATISIRPPMSQDGQTPLANVGFVLYHEGVPVNDFRYLGAEATVDLDWADPWYSRFRNRNLRRQNVAPMSVFLYVDAFEVRKEIIVRPRDLQQWIDLGLEGKALIPVESQEMLKRQVVEFLSSRAPVMVDGRVVPSQLVRIHFIRRSLRSTGVIDPPEDLDLNTAMLGVIFASPVDGLPQEATLTWDLFSPRIGEVPASAVDEAGGMPSVLTPQEPLLRWQNFLTHPDERAAMVVEPPKPRRLRVPLISVFCFTAAVTIVPVAVRRGRRGRGAGRGLGWAAAAAFTAGVLSLPYVPILVSHPLAGAPVLAPAQAAEVVQALLYNAYRAFDVREESRVYDRLARSMSGDLLGDVYLQLRRSMELENQGGARVKVDSVEVLDVTEERRAVGAAGGAATYRCRWDAAGSVGHWGHVHRRANRYDASITIRSVDGTWKITAIEVRQEQRVESGISRRGRG